MKKFLTALLAIFILSASIAHAEIQTYTGSGEYLLTDENLDFAKSRAEIEAERNILNQVCVYVKGHSTLIDNELDNDEVITICAGILHVTETKFKILDDTEGILVKAIVTAEIDLDQAEDMLNRTINERMK